MAMSAELIIMDCSDESAVPTPVEDAMSPEAVVVIPDMAVEVDVAIVICSWSIVLAVLLAGR